MHRAAPSSRTRRCLNLVQPMQYRTAGGLCQGITATNGTNRMFLPGGRGCYRLKTQKQTLHQSISGQLLPSRAPFNIL